MSDDRKPEVKKYALVIDDDKEVLDSARVILPQQGYNYHEIPPEHVLSREYWTDTILTEMIPTDELNIALDINYDLAEDLAKGIGHKIPYSGIGVAMILSIWKQNFGNYSMFDPLKKVLMFSTLEDRITAGESVDPELAFIDNEFLEIYGRVKSTGAYGQQIADGFKLMREGKLPMLNGEEGHESLSKDFYELDK